MADSNSTNGGKSEKDPDAFRTISEVSEELDVPQHVLRFWETKFTIVKPLKRGGGRRYYRPSDIEIIRGIRDLLYTHGFTIKGAQKLLKEQGGKIENIDVLSGEFQKTQPVTTSTPVSDAPAQTTPDDAGLNAGSREKLEGLLQELQAIRRLLPR
ncbi:MerR family transcriptional regulator [Sneathiella limimaris]|uniref:MerR family transcriptional regulator n=1 Tax=Sneathiella limimaris TaxID=1964213 RepID=UPI00146AD45D|nr:MerR family transcriptional regulator [Sneathiella limimaris]